MLLWLCELVVLSFVNVCSCVIVSCALVIVFNLCFCVIVSLCICVIVNLCFCIIVNFYPSVIVNLCACVIVNLCSGVIVIQCSCDIVNLFSWALLLLRTCFLVLLWTYALVIVWNCVLLLSLEWHCLVLLSLPCFTGFNFYQTLDYLYQWFLKMKHWVTFENISGPKWNAYRTCTKSRLTNKMACLKKEEQRCKNASHVITKVLRLTMGSYEKLLEKKKEFKTRALV